MTDLAGALANTDALRPCVEWDKSRGEKGYGKRWDSRARKIRLAHRMAWEEANGPIPEGASILHHCDNPPCIEPTHLYAGTALDNAADRDRRGRRRSPAGEANGRAKITRADVETICSLRAEGATLQSIAERFGLGTSQIHRITRGQEWTQ